MAKNQHGTAADSAGSAYAVRVSVITIIVNVILAVGKFTAGIFGHSGALISDAVHTLSDILSTFVVIAGVKIADKQADEDHPYGHERMECVAAILLATFLGVVGVSIGMSGIETVIGGVNGDLQPPKAIALVAALLSIAIKEGMFWYTRAAAKKVNSGALMADAWHHRSDALSSIGAFIGTLFARLGFPLMDPIAEVVISICIIKAAYDILRDSLNKMVDHSCDRETEEAIRKTALAVEGVYGIRSLKTRLFGTKIYVDMNILVDGELKLREAHDIAAVVHRTIETDFPTCKHCMIHLDPYTVEKKDIPPC